MLVSELEYLPLGFGAHHWLARAADGQRFFVTLDILELDSDPSAKVAALRQTYAASCWLAQQGYEFVHAGLGEVLRPLGDRFALSIYPWRDAAPLVDPEGAATAPMLAQLHSVSPDCFAVEDFVIPHRYALEAALDDLTCDWHGGPHSEPARAATAAHASAIRLLLDDYDSLAAAELCSHAQPWVITHGEPYGPNLLQSASGQLHLVDWDSAKIAPRERDLWELPAPGLQTYLAHTQATAHDHLLRLYRLWYQLAEISVYLAQFRAPHPGDANDATAWENFLHFLPQL